MPDANALQVHVDELRQWKSEHSTGCQRDWAYQHDWNRETDLSLHDLNTRVRAIENKLLLAQGISSGIGALCGSGIALAAAKALGIF